MTLPGSPRSLPLVDDHMNRVDDWLPSLWTFQDMYLVPCNHADNEGMLVKQTGLLRHIREDVAVLRSSMRKMEAALRAIANSNDHSNNQAIAKETLNGTTPHSQDEDQESLEA